jgi:hypothetical protein
VPTNVFESLPLPRVLGRRDLRPSLRPRAHDVAALSTSWWSDTASLPDSRADPRARVPNPVV